MSGIINVRNGRALTAIGPIYLDFAVFVKLFNNPEKLVGDELIGIRAPPEREPCRAEKGHQQDEA
jgi:hypothetical protein